MKKSRSRRHLHAVEPYRYIPDKIAGGSLVSFDAHVIKNPDNGGYMAKRSVAVEYVTKIRGGPMILCCSNAPYCEHFRGTM